MKLTAIILLIACLQVSARGYAQKITLSEKNASLEKVFGEIKKQTEYKFFYDDNLLINTKHVDITVTDASVEHVLEICLKGQGLVYEIIDKVIIVKQKPASVVQVSNTSIGNGAFIDIKGKVTNENGEPIPGVSVTVKGTKQATSTNVYGEFTLSNTDKNATLVFSGSNVETFEVNVAGQAEVMVKLTTKVNKLDEVQVIAYGTTTKRLNTGNIGTVKAEDIAKQPVNNLLLALEGRVPGLFITQSNGLPGSGVTVRIQGQNSISYGNDPLYVIDGVPYVSQMLLTTTGGSGSILGGSGASLRVPGGSGNPLSYINPSDIESVNILKDAEATAIYGSRAANGAILITTKKGKAGQTKVDINVQNGWGKVTRKLDLLNTQQYLGMRREAKMNDNATVSSTDYDMNGIWDSTNYTNWQKVLIGGTSQYSNINVSVSGGTANTQYWFGGTYHRETTAFPGDFSDQKGSIHFNLNSTSTNQKFQIQLSGNYLVDNNQLPSIDLTNQAISLPPDAPALYKPDGTLNWQPNSSGTSTWTNPLSYIYKTFQSKTNNLVSNSILTYHILTGLDIKSSFGYTNMQTNEFGAFPLITVAPESRPFAVRAATYSYSTINSWVIEPQASYKRMIGRGKIDVLVGTTIQQSTGNGLILNGSGYNSDAILADIHSAPTVSVGTTINSVYKYNALFGRVNYNWLDKYIFELTARNDGSSRFGSQNQFHSFGAVSAAWIFSEEENIKNLFPFLNFGKLRGSYGTTGNDQVGDYQFMNLYTSITPAPGIPYQGVTGLSPNGLPNPYLQWEETRKLQVGIDLSFLKERILFTANYAYNRSSNQLLGYSLPIIAGFGSITENFPATVQNTAWEIELNTSNIKGQKFNWSSSLNLTIPQNKLIAFSNLATSSYASALIIGQPITITRAFHFLGVDPATGSYQFADSHGNATSGPQFGADNTTLINTLPKFYGGFQNSFSYKGFSLDVLFQFVRQIGTSSYFFGSSALPPGYKLLNQPISVLKRWQKPGDITSIQRYNSSLSLRSQYSYVRSSDAGFSDASYIRLKNLSLSYQLSKKWMQKARLQNCRIYAQGQNVLTITKFQGMDPENQSASALPPLMVLTLGLQIGL